MDSFFFPNLKWTGELLVIVEYCRYGNLQTYLTHNRSSFINQVDEFGNMISDNAADMDYNAR